MKKKIIFWVLFLYFISGNQLFSQEIASTEIDNYKAQAEQMMRFIERSFNMLGSSTTPAKDKEIIITETYLKFFKDDKVQIEDDLDESRVVPLNKDVQAYLQDIDFFFKEVKFEFTKEEVSHYLTEDGNLFILLKINRLIEGITIQSDTVRNSKPRFIELNVNLQNKDMKIVSIYSTKLNEEEDLKNWWLSLSPEWKAIFTRQNNLQSSPSISDLRRIQNMTDLDISNVATIQNLEPLSQMRQLQRLNFSNTNILDISPLRNLTRLEVLNCENTKVADLTPLRYATDLKELHISLTQVTDLTPVARFQKLIDFSAENCKISNIEALKGLLLLQQINLSGSKILNINDLKQLTKLEKLLLNNTAINDLTALQNLKNLKYLQINNTKVTNVSALNSATSLEELRINNTTISDISPLLNLPKITKIYCDNSGITKEKAEAFAAQKTDCLLIYATEALKTWWSMLPADWKDTFKKYVTIASSVPTDVELHQIANIEEIDISGKQNIRSLNQISMLENLKVLKASGCGISRIEELEELSDLQYIDISNTTVSSVRFLKNHNDLKHLNIENTEVDSLEELLNCRDLRIIYCDKTRIPKEKCIEFLRKKPDCLLVFHTDELQTWWGELEPAWKNIFRTIINFTEPPTKEQLHQITQVDSLSFQETHDIRSLYPLKEFVKLKVLKFSNTSINNLVTLSELTTLEKLECSSSPITSLEPLFTLHSLLYLNCSNTSVNDLEPLTYSKKLETLNISGTQVKNLSPLEKIITLQRLDCSNTLVRTLKPLYNINIKSVICYNSNITEKKVEDFKAIKPDCQVVHY